MPFSPVHNARKFSAVFGTTVEYYEKMKKYFRMVGQTIVVELKIDATFFHFSNLNIEVNPASSLKELTLVDRS